MNRVRHAARRLWSWLISDVGLKMKVLLAFLIAVSALTAVRADKWAPPAPRAYASPSGRFVLRVLPGDGRTGKKPVALILELSSDGSSYAKKREFALVNRWAPVEACISDTSEVFTFDDWGMMGHEHVVVCYSTDGKKKSEYALSQLFPAKQLAEIREKHSSASSIHWRSGKPYINGPHLIVHDTVGGYVTLTEGVLEYTPRE